MQQYREYQAIRLTCPPSELAKTVFGSVKRAGDIVGVRPATWFNWNRYQRIPVSAWRAMMASDKADQVLSATVSTKPIKLRMPYTLRKTYQAATPAVVKQRTVSAAPVTTSAASLSAKVAELEQTNAELLRQLNAVRLALRD